VSKPTVDFGQSARARLLAVANRQGVQLEYVLLRYAFERFLYRLGESAYANRFILKGASAFAVWVGPFCRVTRDADFEVFGDASTEALLAAFKEICAVAHPEDGIAFDLSSFAATVIKKEDKYPGVRVTFSASIGGARVGLQCDVVCGDSVYPLAETTDYPVLLNNAPPRVRVYPRYTVVAEKFQVMVVRGLLNSRLKDYYDLWLLTERFDFDLQLLRTAVERTFARRGTAMPNAMPDSLTAAFSDIPTKRTQWRAFLRKANLDALDFGAVVSRLAEFLSPIVESVENDLVWRCSETEWGC